MSFHCHLMEINQMDDHKIHQCLYDHRSKNKNKITLKVFSFLLPEANTEKTEDVDVEDKEESVRF